MRHPDLARHWRRDGRREFTYAALMGMIDRRLRRRAALRHAWVALACCTALAAPLSPSLASAAGSDSEPRLAERLGEIAGSVWGKAESYLIAPARLSAASVLADKRTEEIYQHLSATA